MTALIAAWRCHSRKYEIAVNVVLFGYAFILAVVKIVDGTGPWWMPALVAIVARGPAFAESANRILLSWRDRSLAAENAKLREDLEASEARNTKFRTEIGALNVAINALHNRVKELEETQKGPPL